MTFPSCLVGCFVAAVAMAYPGAPQAQDITLTISHGSTGLRTGDAALLTVRASQPLSGLEGEAFGQQVRFWPGRGPEEWNGLLGIGLNVAAGRYDLVVRGRGAQGQTGAGQLSLLVEEREFQTRRIQVAAQFVDPPEEQVERILREADVLASLFEPPHQARLWRGPFALPVPGSATSGFGRRTVMNGEPRGQHRGADFRAAEGTPIRSPNIGEVVLAEDLYFTGNTVVVDHGSGLVSLFAHLSRLEVTKGAHVASGDLLGEAGSTGRVTGPHLHWTVRLGAASVDPMSLVAAVADLEEQPEH